MAKKVSGNSLTSVEVALIKAFLREGGYSNQEIIAYFSRPNRSINQGRIVDIKTEKTYKQIQAASKDDLNRFILNWPEYNYITGLHPTDDELVVKSREAMLNAIAGYNSPGIMFRTECFIVLAVIAWTYLLHRFYAKNGVDYRSKKQDGTLITTSHGAQKYWELETCLRAPECPLDDVIKANLRFIIVIRHEIEHQMTKRIDEALSAKIQACVLNFNATLKKLFGHRAGLDRDATIAIQLAGIQREQRDLLLRDMGLPPSFLAAQAAFEQDLPEDVVRDERYAWRVMLVQRNTNSKGAADEVIQFVPPGSDLETEINRVIFKDREKKKYRPSDIVLEIQKAGYPDFTQYQHTLLVREKGSKDPKKPFGTFVDIHNKDWRWYQSWLDEVLNHCDNNKLKYGFKVENESDEL